MPSAKRSQRKESRSQRVATQELEQSSADLELAGEANGSGKQDRAPSDDEGIDGDHDRTASGTRWRIQLVGLSACCIFIVAMLLLDVLIFYSDEPTEEQPSLAVALLDGDSHLPPLRSPSTPHGPPVAPTVQPTPPLLSPAYAEPLPSMLPSSPRSPPALPRTPTSPPQPPSPPESPPPPYLLWPGPLSAEKCEAMMGDPAGLFRKMFAAHPFQQRQRNKPDCWDIRRDDRSKRQQAHQYFNETLAGDHCASNWYEGNPDELGEADRTPSFSANSPALLGFDETIDDYCRLQPMVNYAATQAGGYWHATQCIGANLNILSLYGVRVPYNICRNLEWMVCAAGGKLPGQNTPKILFSIAPRDLDPGPTSTKPFGQCRGWRDKAGSCEGGYATDDIFFLEACLFNQICSNHDELWQLDAGTPWECHLSVDRFDELKGMLIAEPDWGAPQGLLPACDVWCNKWTCTHKACSGCGHSVHSDRHICADEI